MRAARTAVGYCSAIQGHETGEAPVRIGVLTAAACVIVFAATPASASTIVRFRTSLGNIDVRLFDTATPLSVENFLNYVNDGDYVDSFIHRMPPDFVIQGGGFTVDDTGIAEVPRDPPVINEPGLTNHRGTLAYAKVGGNPNSATNGWFFNLTDENADSPSKGQLDTQNGGFTVFGSVIRGTSVMDAIAGLSVINFSNFADLPVLPSYDGQTLRREDLVYVHSVVVLGIPPGDYTLDGVVDGNDLTRWRNHYGFTLRIEDHATASPPTVMNADGNGDGVVNAADYTIWRDAFSAGSAAAAAPEPSAAAMLVTALGGLLRRRKR